MNTQLNNAKLITSKEYCNLPDTPEFIGQTQLDDNSMYFMLFRTQGKLYKTHNKL